MSQAELSQETTELVVNMIRTCVNSGILMYLSVLKILKDSGDENCNCRSWRSRNSPRPNVK